jgi:hypothetical protein
MPRDILPKFSNDDFDRLGTVPSPVGSTFIEQLMAAPGVNIPDDFDIEIREAVTEAILDLDEASRFYIESRYIWGYSYSEIATMLGYNSKSTAYDRMKDAEAVLRNKLLESPIIRGFLGGNMKTWDEAARFELDRITTALKANYKFDGDLFDNYSIMLGDAVRSGSDQDIVVWAWYTAIEAARFLDTQSMWEPRELEKVLVSKQHDYGHDNINAFGQIGIAVRLSDKIARYYNLGRRDVVAKNEPFIDCIKDMVGYGVISAMLAAGTFNLDLAEG